MKINFMHNNKNYTLCTIKEFAKSLAEKAANEPISGKTKFIADFGFADFDEVTQIDVDKLDMYVHAVNGWYGVKELGEIGFNSEAKQFVFGHYGSDCSHIISMYPDDFVYGDIENDILKILKDMLEVDKTNWYLVVQWDEDEVLVQDRKEAEKSLVGYKVIDLPICYVNLITDCLETIKEHNLFSLLSYDENCIDAAKSHLEEVLDEFCEPLDELCVDTKIIIEEDK